MLNGKRSPMRNPKSIYCMLLWFLTSLFPIGISGYLSAASITTVEILEKAEIEEDKILLGKIANIKGEDPDLVQKLKEIVVGKAPLPGNSRQIDEDYLKLRLKQCGTDLCQIRLQAPEIIEVSRDFVEIPREKIEKIVLDFIYEKSPWGRARLDVKNIQVSHMVVLPKGDITYKVVPPRNTEYLGTIPLAVLFMVNGRFEKKVWATVKTEVLTAVVVTKRPLGRFKRIEPDDIHLQKMDLADLPSNIITNIEEALGKRTKRTIDAKVVLRTDLIEFPPLVRRGDVVTIIAESDGLKITTRGKIKERGCRGEKIKVVNLNSNKVIYARILDSNTVKVDF
jgi:flagella basal body P-ring formation protein FlgA